jgi:hypothetical protein
VCKGALIGFRNAAQWQSIRPEAKNATGFDEPCEKATNAGGCASNRRDPFEIKNDSENG